MALHTSGAAAGPPLSLGSETPAGGGCEGGAGMIAMRGFRLKEFSVSATLSLPDRGDLRFSDLLAARLLRSGVRRKGRRRKIALRIAAARQFEQFGYDQVGAADIATAAGLSRAGFYVYFRDKAHIAVSVLRPFVAVVFPMGGAPSNTAATANLEQLYGLINDNRRLVQCLEPLRAEAPRFVQEVDARILCWHGHLLRDAGLDARLAGLLSAMSIGLAWRPAAKQDWGAGRVTELLSPLLSENGDCARRRRCPPANREKGQADVSWRGRFSAHS